MYLSTKNSTAVPIEILNMLYITFVERKCGNKDDSAAVVSNIGMWKGSKPKVEGHAVEL
jgi:hypothetical protein